MRLSTDPGAWMAALSILAIYSFLVKENRVYRMVEHLYVGLGAGHAIAMGWHNIRTMGINPVVRDGRYEMLIPLFLGLLLYTRFTRKLHHLSRIPLAVTIGIGSGMALRGLPSAQILAQVRATMLPLTNINNILLATGVCCVLAFFFFTVKQGPVMRGVATVGKWTMMITFGVTIATAVFQHTSFVITTFNTILGRWLGLL